MDLVYALRLRDGGHLLGIFTTPEAAEVAADALPGRKSQMHPTYVTPILLDQIAPNALHTSIRINRDGVIKQVWQTPGLGMEGFSLYDDNQNLVWIVRTNDVDEARFKVAEEWERIINEGRWGVSPNILRMGKRKGYQ